LIQFTRSRKLDSKQVPTSFYYILKALIDFSGKALFFMSKCALRHFAALFKNECFELLIQVCSHVWRYEESSRPHIWKFPHIEMLAQSLWFTRSRDVKSRCT